MNYKALSQEFYGSGVIQAQTNNNLNLPGLIMAKGGNQQIKEPVSYPYNEKIDRNAPNNYTTYFNEPVDKLNYDESEQSKLDQGLDFIEHTVNENLDFDGDGAPDIDLYNYKLIDDPKSEEVADFYNQIPHDNCDDEAKEETLDSTLKEKSTKVNIQEKPIVESALVSDEQQKPKTYEKPQNDLKSVDGMPTDKKISMSDGLIMGAGGLALAMMLLGRTN